MSEDTAACPICATKDISTQHYSNGTSFTCRRCGQFKLTGSAHGMVQAASPSGRIAANASAWIREHEGVLLDSRDLKSLWSLRTPSVAERGTKVLQELERRFPDVGASFTFQFPDIGRTAPHWLSVSWSESVSELQFLVVQYLRNSLQAIEGKEVPIGGDTSFVEIHISPRGFELLDQLKQANPESAIGFCAMWFSDELKPLWANSIEPAIRAAGYDPKRIDQHEHTNRIDDEIVAMIRRSRFVVADFTGQRGGVYFEAGYALGQGLRVIWTCREEELESVHFDTRQYNFLIWKPGEYADLAKRLQNRIEATLGRGPIR